MKRYTLRDLEKELHGVKMGGRALATQLVQSLGAKNAMQWYYQTLVPEFNNCSPHTYVKTRGEKGKEHLVHAIYDLLTGQPD